MTLSLRSATATFAFGLIVGLGPSAQAATIIVTPNAMGTWALDNRNASGVIGANPGAVGALVTGPAIPPLGNGSANLQSGLGGGGSELRNSDYAGVKLNSINALSYSTYVTSGNGQQAPYFQFYISTAGGTPYNDRLTFEPTYSSKTQGQVSTGLWQSWNLLTGLWYDDIGPSGPGVDNAVPLASFMAEFPNATLVNPSGFSDGTNNNISLGGVRFTTGFADTNLNFNGNVDAFTIGVGRSTTTYDFEPVPEPATLAILGIALAGLAVLRQRRGAML